MNMKEGNEYNSLNKYFWWRMNIRNAKDFVYNYDKIRELFFWNHIKGIRQYLQTELEKVISLTLKTMPKEMVYAFLYTLFKDGYINHINTNNGIIYYPTRQLIDEFKEKYPEAMPSEKISV